MEEKGGVVVMAKVIMPLVGLELSLKVEGGKVVGKIGVMMAEAGRELGRRW